MSNFFSRVITASAGTGKTYRLSIEFIALLLVYYQKTEFSIDNILVLTFTRKATAEIKERIYSHIKLLTLADDDKDKKGLVQSLREILPRDYIDTIDADLIDSGSLSVIEQNILGSVYRDISCNKNLLQIMTIDSYIGAIFRNLIRPVRSIDNFEIDELAIEKRMPYLMDHMMQPGFRSKVDALLRRKVSPSLDEYSAFFISLIKERWLYYLITKRVIGLTPDSLCGKFSEPETWESTAFAELDEAKDRLLTLLNKIISKATAKDNKLPEKHFKAKFKDVFDSFPETYDELISSVKRMLNDLEQCRKLFKGIKADVLWHKNDFPTKDSASEVEAMNVLWTEIVTHLANYLVYKLILPEQEEILRIWGSILKEYDKFIYRYKNMTYDDISWFTFEALYSQVPPLFDPLDEVIANEFYQFLSHRSRFILIDEFQDTSLLQFNILSPIIREVISGVGSKPFGGFIVVGDEKQSIFGWRGGERDLLLNLPQIFAEYQIVESCSLDTSWRSSQFLIDFINAIFADNALQQHLQEKDMKWKYSDIASAKASLDPLSMLQFRALPHQKSSKSSIRTIDDVYRIFVNDMVVPSINKGESIAILCRKGKELMEVQALLDESKEGSIFQPSANLMEHHLIKPLLAWLRFMAYRNWQDFLSFLRSDYVMLNAEALKKVVDSISACIKEEEPQEPDFSEVPMVMSFYGLSKSLQSSLLSVSCMQIVEICLPRKALNERDYLNLHAFLNALKEYELNHNNDNASIPGFLNYLEENQRQDVLRQRSVENSDTLELQTIHKAKGLQYDRVFVFYNLSSRSRDRERKLTPFISYSDYSFENLSDFAITVHYEDVLAKSKYGRLVQLEDFREELEELNTLYVAFTRAKTKLHVFFTYESSNAWEQYLSERNTDKITLPMLLCDACQNYMLRNESVESGGTFTMGNPASVGCEDSEKQALDSLHKIEIPDWKELSDPELIPLELPQAMKEKDNWLHKRSALFGNIAHYYLSFLYRNTKQEKEYGLSQVIRTYSSVLKQDEIREFIFNLDSRINDLPALFDPCYDRIFTELPIYDGSKTYRIDRLMVDTSNKKVMIYDYKTGSIPDLHQLDHYKTILQNIPYFAGGDFTINTAYVSI